MGYDLLTQKLKCCDQEVIYTREQRWSVCTCFMFNVHVSMQNKIFKQTHAVSNDTYIHNNSIQNYNQVIFINTEVKIKKIPL